MALGRSLVLNAVSTSRSAAIAITRDARCSAHSYGYFTRYSIASVNAWRFVDDVVTSSPPNCVTTFPGSATGCFMAPASITP